MWSDHPVEYTILGDRVLNQIKKFQGARTGVALWLLAWFPIQGEEDGPPGDGSGIIGLLDDEVEICAGHGALGLGMWLTDRRRRHGQAAYATYDILKLLEFTFLRDTTRYSVIGRRTRL